MTTQHQPGPGRPGKSGRVPSRQPQVLVLVLTWNGMATIAGCLESLLAQDYPALHVMVVDNGSTDGTPERVAQRFPGVRLVCSPHNLGFAAGNNLGLRALAGDPAIDTVVLLNQDTRVHPGWLAALLSAFDDPAVGIAGCKLLYPNGTLQHAGGLTHGPRAETDHLGRGAPGDSSGGPPVAAEFVTGAALAIRRETLDCIGLLDEGFSPAYYEDIDWCYRARAAGWQVVVVPEAVATHLESTTTAADTHERKFALHQGRLRFALKHRPLDWLLAEFGPAERAWVTSVDRIEELMAARRAYLVCLLALPDIAAFRQANPATAAGCQANPAEYRQLTALLADLRAAAVEGLATVQVPSPAHWPAQPPPAEPAAPARASALPEGPGEEAGGTRARLLAELEAAQTIQEVPFTSTVPVIGPLIAGFRSLWNSVSTRWYVRPLLHQQNVFNARLVGQVRVLQEQLDSLEQLHQGVAQLGQAAAQLGRAAEWHGELIGWLSRRADQLEWQSGGQAHLLKGQVRDVAENIRELTTLAERLALRPADEAGLASLQAPEGASGGRPAEKAGPAALQAKPGVSAPPAAEPPGSQRVKN